MFIFKLERDINSSEWTTTTFGGDTYITEPFEQSPVVPEMVNPPSRQIRITRAVDWSTIIALGLSDVLYVMNYDGKTIDVLRGTDHNPARVG